MKKLVSFLIIAGMLLSGVINVSAEDARYHTAVSTGKSYTVSVAPHSNYLDTNGTELTDGMLAPRNSGSYYNGKLSGYTSSVQITVDLGEVTAEVYGFCVSYLSVRKDGVGVPTSVSVQTSADGEEWSASERLTMPEYVAETAQTAELYLENKISTRFVRFSVVKSWVFVFLDEVEIIADVYRETAEDAFNRQVNAAYSADAVTFEQRAQALAAVSTSEPDRSLERHLLSKGADYSATAEPVEAYPDGSKKLTDGKTEKAFDSGAWVGYPASQPVSITVTLPEQRDDVADFSLFAFSSTGLGIAFPVCVDFEVSSDNVNFTSVGRIYGSSKLTETREYQLNLEKCVSAKFVRFTLSGEQADYFLIDEAAVYGYGEKQRVFLYPDIVIPKVTENEYWDSSAEDYSETQNLILGLPMQVMCGSEPEEAEWQYQTPMPCTVLTDGIYSKTLNVHDPSFFQSHGDTHRDIVFDLTKVSALSSFRASFARRTGWGVYSPSKVDICVSVDGDLWHDIGSIAMPDTDNVFERANLELETPIKARFVCFSYEHQIWGGCDELEAVGTKNADSAIDPSTVSIRSRHLVADRYQVPDENILCGVNDLLIAYYSTSFDWTENYFKPYLAYLDRDYNAQDLMFDGYLFALSGEFPSGQRGYENSVMTDWQWEINKLFADGKNLAALNNAAGGMINELQLGDFKYKFYVSLYFPAKATSDFGDVDGDGISEDLSIAENRVKVEKWYIDSFYERYDADTYENLEFGGFYWYNEAIVPNEGNIALLRGVADYVHAKGSQFFWIPYYLAKGFNCWEVFGFDACSMQPNYAFSLDTSISRIEICSTLSKRYGMCNEIEFTGSCFSNDTFLARYYEYLKGGLYHGYDTATHTYYQDVTGYYTACYSANERARRIYDYTYQFIAGTLDVTKCDAVQSDFSVDDETVLCSALVGNGDTMNKFRLAVSPKHGSVTVNPDGTFRYYPDKNFVGSDSFKYIYDNSFVDSEECTAAIKVGRLTMSSESLLLTVGSNQKLNAAYSHAMQHPTVTWKTGNSAIASVSSDGTVTARRRGNVIVTAETSDGSYSAQCTVQVRPVPPTVYITCMSGSTNQKVSWWKSYSSAKMSLGAKVLNCPDAARIVWSSSNSKVTVDANGNIRNRGIGARSSTITVCVFDSDGIPLASAHTDVCFYKFNR